MVSTTNMWTIVCSWYGYVDLYIGGIGMWIFVWLLLSQLNEIILYFVNDFWDLRGLL